MDRRGSLGLALCLLSASVGCQHETRIVSPGELASSSPWGSGVDPSKIKKMELPKKEPPTSMLVSSGDFKVGESFAADVTPDVQQLLRDEARQDYQRALKIDPKCVSAYQGLARLYTASQDHARAVEAYQKALQLVPRNASLWYELGMCHNYQKEWGPALDCLGKAGQIDPGNHTYVNAMGVVLTESGRLEEGLSCFVRANGEAMGCYRLAQTLQRLQQPELSRRYLEMAVQKDPNLATTLAAQSAPSNGAVVQRTSYEAPSVPPVTMAQPTPAPAPRAIQPEAVEDNHAAPQPIDVPPPPPVNLHYGQ